MSPITPPFNIQQRKCPKNPESETSGQNCSNGIPPSEQALSKQCCRHHPQAA